MSNKTRKYAWPVSVAMAFALVAALAAFIVLASPPGVALAHNPGTDHTTTCTPDGTVPGPVVIHDALAGTSTNEDGTRHNCANPGMDVTEPVNGDNGNGDNGMMDDRMVTPNMMYAYMPYDFWLEGLDNGARLDWKKPMDVMDGGTVVGYRIDRDAWNSTMGHPINTYGDATIDQIGSATDHSDLGLAYETVYTYRALAIVDLDVATWWNKLNCAEMNKLADSNDVMGEGFCRMYAPLSDAEKAVVRQAHADLEEMYPGRHMSADGAYADNAYGRYQLGQWTYKRAIETADSGGRLDALLDPPSPVRNLDADPACADMITVSWNPPMDFGTVFTTDQNGMYVGPDYIGGQVAGLEAVGEDATSVTYHIQRMVDGGAWSMGMYQSATTYVDENVEYGKTYKYRVRAKNDSNLYSDWMMVTEPLTEDPAPLRPTSLVVNLEEDQQGFELQWDPPADEANPKLWRDMADFNAAKAAGDYESENLTYVIEWQVGNDDWDQIKRQAHQYSRSGLDTVLTQEFIHSAETDDDFSLSAIRGSEVRYRVSAQVKLCNASDWVQADEVEVPAATEPGMPTELTATAMGQNQIDLSWTAPDDGGSDITGYTFEYSTDGGNAWSDPMATDSMTSHSHTGLTAGTAYTYRVMAMNAVGSSMASATAMQTTAAAPTLGAPAIASVSSAAAGSATITLTPSANATKQFVWAFRVGGTSNATDGMWSAQAAGNATSVTMTGLTSGASYWFIAIAGSGEGDQTRWSRWSGWTAPTSIQ